MSELTLESIGPLDHEFLLRSDVLYAADRHEQVAKTMDKSAQRHAVDRYILWVAPDADIPLKSRRIMLAPPKTDATLDGVEKAYVYYPIKRESFISNEDHSQLIFMRIVSAKDEEVRYVVTPNRFLIFMDDEEIRVDPYVLNLSDFSFQDPGSMFITNPSGEVFDEQYAEEIANLSLLRQIMHSYKLKAQPSPEAS